MLDTLPPELIKLISNALCIVDIISLKLTCVKTKELPTNINEKMSNELHKRFPSIIIQSMKENNIVITGSFMLRFLYDASWDPNDIDLYIESEFSDDRWNFIKCLLKNGYTEIEQAGTPHNYIISRYYTNGAQKLNLVSLATIDPIYYIFKVSDTDIGKVAYNCHLTKLYIKDWYKLIKRQDHIVPLSLITASIYDGSIVKYDQIDNPDQNILLEPHMLKMYERIEKYNHRGFDLLISPRMNEILTIINDDYKNFVTDTTKITKNMYINLQEYLEKYHTDTSILLQLY